MRARKQEGAVAVLAALLLVLLMGFAGFAVDLSTKYRVRTESQSAVDAAALAGAHELDGTATGTARAIAEAVAVGNRHYVYTDGIALAADNVTLGNWNLTTRVFTATNTAADVNAVRVAYTEAQVAHPFAAPLVGTASSPVAAQATAVGGGPSQVSCGFPLIMADCSVQPAPGALNCDQCLVMGRATDDTVGWSMPTNPVNNGTIGPVVAQACATIDADGTCTGTCTTAAAGNTVETGEGNNFNDQAGGLCDELGDALGRSPTGTLRVRIPIYDETGGGCNPNFGGPAVAVTGYAQLEIVGIRCGNNRPAIGDPVWLDTCGVAATAGRYIMARIQCDVQEDQPGGGGFFGVAARPALVD